MNEGVSQIHAKVERLRRTYFERDRRMMDVHDVRSGELDNIMPGAMPDAWPKPIVANLIDTTARDIAEVMATMPSVNCSSEIQITDRSKKFAGKRTRIANWYLYNSEMSVQQIAFCDHYNTYGMGIYIIEPDFDKKTPRLRVENPMHTYPEIDVWGKIHSFTKVWREQATVLAAKFPMFSRILLGEDKASTGSDPMLEVVKYCDKDKYLLYLPERGCLVLEEMDNPFGCVPIAVAVRPGFDDEIRGTFDGAIWVQLAKARMALLGLEATEKTVKAPLALPRDVQKMTFGGDGIIRTDSPDKVRYVGMDFPQAALQEGQLLERELMLGVRSNQARQGEIDASVITGRGVQALQGGFNTLIATGQVVIGKALEKAIALCFKMDEKFWPSEQKQVRGVHQGTPFEEKYTPAKDINGDHTVDVTYGFAAGLDPSRALVFLLQLRGDQLVPRDFVQRQLPMDINVMELQAQIDLEQLVDAAKSGVFAYVQSAGMIAQQGGDPLEPLMRLAEIIKLRTKGTPMHEAILKAFTPKEEPPAPEAQDPLAALLGGGGPPGLGGPGGQQQTGAPGADAQGVPQDMMTLLASLTGGGKANLGATVKQNLPIG